MLSPAHSTTTPAPPAPRPATADPPGVRLVALHFDPLPLYLAQHGDPLLARTPLVCVEDEHVVHANPVARRHGITPGMRLSGARMRVEGLRLTHHQEPDLQHAWNELLREIHGLTPWLEPGRRGRLLARLEEREARDLAARHGIRAGVADSRELAELAAVSARPGEARSVAPGDEHAFFERLPLRFLKGVGLSEGNLTRLRWLGLATAGELAAWTPSQLRSYLGEEGEALRVYLHGPHDDRLQPFRPPSTLRRSVAFDEPACEPYAWLPAIERLATELERALAGRVARRLTLTATLPQGARRASRLSKRPLARAPQIRQQALFALDDTGIARTGGAGIERLTLELAEPERLALQSGLWQQRERRQRAAWHTLERYPGALLRFAWRDPYAQAADLAWEWERLEPSALEVAATPAVRGAARASAPEAHPRALVRAAAVPLFADLPGPSAGAPAALRTPEDAPDPFPAPPHPPAPGMPAALRPPDATPEDAPRPGDTGASSPPDLLLFPLSPTPEDDHAPAHAARPGHVARPPARHGELVVPHP